jgi:hypothetical protein
VDFVDTRISFTPEKSEFKKPIQIQPKKKLTIWFSIVLLKSKFLDRCTELDENKQREKHVRKWRKIRKFEEMNKYMKNKLCYGTSEDTGSITTIKIIEGRTVTRFCRGQFGSGKRSLKHEEREKSMNSMKLYVVTSSGSCNFSSFHQNSNKVFEVNFASLFEVRLTSVYGDWMPGYRRFEARVPVCQYCRQSLCRM